MRNDFDMQRNYRNLWQDDFVAKLPVSISALSQASCFLYQGREKDGGKTNTECLLARIAE